MVFGNCINLASAGGVQQSICWHYFPAFWLFYIFGILTDRSLQRHSNREFFCTSLNSNAFNLVYTMKRFEVKNRM